MDFGNFERLRMPASYVSADVIIYRLIQKGRLEILCGRRQDDPWRGALSVCFGGYVDDSDVNIIDTAIREVKEETGLVVLSVVFVGIYGPERYHYRFDVDGQLIKTEQPAHVRPVVANVFAGRVVGGELVDTAEQKELHWVYVEDIKKETLAFDHARALYHLQKMLRQAFLMGHWPNDAISLIK